MSKAEFAGAVRQAMHIDLFAAQVKTPFLTWLEQAKTEDLYRINAFDLADTLKVDRSLLLEYFIRLTGAGFFNLNWDYHCPFCHGIAETHQHLQEATAANYCAVCRVDFINTLDANVEVTFTPAEKHIQIPAAHIQRMKELMMEMIQNKQLELADPHVTGLDCLHIAAFREIFADDVLSTNESLAIKQICILFTDIKGSTPLYERLGDAKAYRLVRQHFEIMFDLIPANNGVVVKTIGDAVMASFQSAADGAAAAVAIHKAFAAFNAAKQDKNEILVKMGLHAGPVIMVNLNGRVDYFGRVVNLASRIQGQAQACHVLISEGIKNDPEVVQVLKRDVKSLMWREVELKGIEEARKVYRLNFSDPALNCGLDE